MGRTQFVQHWKTGRAAFTRATAAQDGETHAWFYFPDGKKEWRRVAAFKGAAEPNIGLQLRLDHGSAGVYAEGTTISKTDDATQGLVSSAHM